MTSAAMFDIGLVLNESPFGNLAKSIAQINRDNGWFEIHRSLSDELMLIVGEVAEAHEEDRRGKGANERYYTFNTADPDFPNEAPGIDVTRIPIRFRKPEGIPSEMADIIIRVLDLCYRYDIDIDAVLEEKLAYNETRGLRHGGKRF